MKPIMTMRETETEYIATVNEYTATIPKDVVIIRNGIKQHPRLLAIEEVSHLASLKDWILFNV